MEENRKDTNIQIGKRLREARNNLGRKQAEFAYSLGISEEHYRKYESGATGLSADKLSILFSACSTKTFDFTDFVERSISYIYIQTRVFWI